MIHHSVWNRLAEIDAGLDRWATSYEGLSVRNSNADSV